MSSYDTAFSTSLKRLRVFFSMAGSSIVVNHG